jgi:PHP family Zn ribbon phosphoesterase
VKIKATCRRCDREFHAEQAVAAGGACPWCNEPLNADYAVTLVNALREADEAGTALERALTAIADLDPSMEIASGSVTGEVGRQLRRLSSRALAQP